MRRSFPVSSTVGDLDDVDPGNNSSGPFRAVSTGRASQGSARRGASTQSARSNDVQANFAPVLTDVFILSAMEH